MGLSPSSLDSLVKATDKATAQTLLDEYIEDIQRYYRAASDLKNYTEAKRLALNNIGYYAGYYDQETRERVELLYGARHPVLGSALGNQLTSEQIYKIGVDYGLSKGKSSSTLEEIRAKELIENILKKIDEDE
jgi:hypothetical protein